MNKKAFLGKTIKSMDTQAINVIKFVFTDGTEIELYAEVMHTGIPFFYTAEPEEPK